MHFIIIIIIITIIIIYNFAFLVSLKKSKLLYILTIRSRDEQILCM